VGDDGVIDGCRVGDASIDALEIGAHCPEQVYPL